MDGHLIKKEIRKPWTQNSRFTTALCQSSNIPAVCKQGVSIPLESGKDSLDLVDVGEMKSTSEKVLKTLFNLVKSLVQRVQPRNEAFRLVEIRKPQNREFCTKHLFHCWRDEIHFRNSIKNTFQSGQIVGSMCTTAKWGIPFGRDSKTPELWILH